MLRPQLSAGISSRFCPIELSPLQDGMIFVALTATTVDKEEPQLLDQKIATEKVTTIDDVLALRVASWAEPQGNPSR